MEVREAVGEYLASLKRLRPRSRIGYEQRLLVFSSWCEQHKVLLEHIRPRHVDDFVEHIEKTHTGSATGSAVSTYTLAGYVRVIKAFLNWCSEDDEYSQFVKPILPRRVKVPKVVEKIVETFTDEQIEALIMAAKQNYNEHLRLRDACIVQVLVSTGMRAFELCGLTIENVHLEPHDSYVKVLGKGQKEREIPIDTPSRRLVKRYLRDYREEAKKDAPLFVDRAERDGLTVNGLEEIMDRLGRWAGIEGIRCSPHTLRHTYATRFMRNGGDIFHLQKFMGHSQISTTQNYLKSLSSRDIRLSLRKVE